MSDLQLSEDALSCMNDIIQKAEDEFSLESFYKLIQDANLENNEKEVICYSLVVLNGVYNGLNSFRDDYMTKAMSEETRGYLCEVCAGACVAIWSSWGAAVAVGLGVMTAGVGSAVATLVGVFASPLFSKAIGC